MKRQHTAGTNRRACRVALAALAAVLGVASATAAQNAAGLRDDRRRIAVEPLEWAAVTDPVQKIFKTNVDVGKSFQSLIVNRLQQGGRVRVMERGQLERVLHEQDFSASNRTQREAKGRIGRVLGVDALLVGEIVAFGRDDRRKKFGFGGIGLGLPGLGGLGIESREDKAVVVVSYRIVDAETAEVLAGGEARGESSRKSKGLGGLFGWPGGIVGGAVDMTSANFQKTIIGEATIAAADRLVEAVNAKAPTLARKEIEIEARVALVSDDTVTLAKGAEDGVEVGDRFEVFRIVREIKDPQTGEVLDQEVAKLGQMVVTSVRPRVATGSYAGSPVTTADGLARKVQP